MKNTMFDETRYKVILETSAYQFGVSVEDIKGKSREARIVNARHVAMSLMRVFFECSFADIGKVFNRNHATVMSACRRVEQNKTLQAAAIVAAKAHVTQLKSNKE
jgi:chromosomal replication initiation ATPase DnaA